MSLCKMSFWSASLGKWSEMNVIVPEGKPGPFPVLVLLHGYSDDYSIWQRRTSLERWLDGVPLIVAMPDGARSFYCNDPRPGGYLYEDHIVRDVVGCLDRTFHTLPRRTSRAIAGLSMGGYGATMLALRHPDVFGAAVSHSGAFGSPRNVDKVVRDIVKRLPRNKYNCYLLARKTLRKGPVPAFRFDCGTSDFLYDENRSFHAYLKKIGYPHEFHEHPGAHTWEYWDTHIRDTIRFVRDKLER